MRFTLAVRQYWPWGLVFVLGYTFFLLITLPASVAYGFLAPKHFQVSGIEGTLWSGQANQVQAKGIPLEKLQWQLNALSFLVGSVSVDVKFQDDTTMGEGNIRIALGGEMTLQDWQIRFPAQLLMPLLYGLPIALDGQLSGKIFHLVIDPGQAFILEGRVVWQDAGLTAPNELRLGDLQLTMEPDDQGSKGVLADQGGPLLAEGVLHIGADGKYSLQAQLAARSTAHKSLQQALSMLGRTDAKGKVTFKRRGKLPSW